MLKQAIFLVGGRGTRLGHLTDNTPKPLLHVGKRPFLDYLIEKAVCHGLSNIVLLAGYLGQRVAEYYGSNPIPGATIRVAIEPTQLGTGGALRVARDILDDRFILANGDTLFDFNWLDLERASRDAIATLALRAIEAPGRYSSVTLRGDRIVRFGDTCEGNGNCLINGGVYLLSRNIVADLGTGEVSLEADVFPKLAAEEKLRGFVGDGYFLDMGIPTDFKRAQSEIPARAVRKAIIFDRDGTLNEDPGYLHDWRDFRWIAGAPDAIRLANDLGYWVCVATNQAGVGRGYYDKAAVEALHQRMNKDLARYGAHINQFEYCPHHPEATLEHYRHDCFRRKPNPGMVLACIKKWAVKPTDCLMIGDKTIDMAAAHAAGVNGYLFKGGNLREFVAPLLSPYDND